MLKPDEMEAAGEPSRDRPANEKSTSDIDELTERRERRDDREPALPFLLIVQSVEEDDTDRLARWPLVELVHSAQLPSSCLLAFLLFSL